MTAAWLWLNCREGKSARRQVSVEAAPPKPLTGFGGGIQIQDAGTLKSAKRMSIDPDVVTPSDELKRVRKTKMVCTIGPTSCSKENLFRLAEEVQAHSRTFLAASCLALRITDDESAARLLPVGECMNSHPKDCIRSSSLCHDNIGFQNNHISAVCPHPPQISQGAALPEEAPQVFSFSLSRAMWEARPEQLQKCSIPLILQS